MISLAEEAGLECQRKGFRLYPIDNVELYTVIEFIQSSKTDSRNDARDARIDIDTNKSHKSDRCYDECIN